jgi:hypothetical protein
VKELAESALLDDLHGPGLTDLIVDLGPAPLVTADEWLSIDRWLSAATGQLRGQLSQGIESAGRA